MRTRAVSAASTACTFAFALLTVGYGLRVIGDHRDLLANALGAALFVATCWCVRPSVTRAHWRFDLVACSTAVAFGLLPLPLRPALLVAAWLAIHASLDASSRAARVLHAIVIGLALWTPIWFVLHSTAAGFGATQAWAHGLSRLSEFVPGAHVHFGSRAAGVDLVLLAWSIALAGSSTGVLRSGLVAAFSVLCFQCAWVVGSLPLLRLAADVLGLHGLLISDLVWVLAAALASWLTVAEARSRVARASSSFTSGSLGEFSLAVPALLACALVVPWGGGAVAAADRPRVALHDPGYLDRRTPATDPDVFGNRASGMFGAFATWGDVCGFDVSSVDLAGEFDFASIDVVVLVNLVESLPTSARERLQEFVESGGGLLVLADHTGFDAIRGPSNEVVSRWGIEVNFDSAVGTRRSWADGFELRPHSVTRSITDQEEIQIWTGASLATHWPAEPIVLGRDAFADAGDPHNRERGHLGDMNHQAVEHLGDVVLVAAAEPERGRVLVFGDTSTFQNLALCRSRGFAEQCVRWLGGAESAWLSTSARNVLGALALVLVLVAAAWTRVASRSASLLFALLPAVALPFGAGEGWRPSRARSDVSIAHVDYAHATRATRLGWYGDGIGGLEHALFRAGFQPFAPREFRADLLDEASLFVSVTPTRPFASDELDVLERWLDEGGIAVLTLGQPHASLQPELLARFDLAVGEIPLGPAEVTTDLGAMRFYDAYPTVAHPADASVWVSVHDLPVITWIPRGRGGLLFVSDSQFLLNKNLEDDDEFIEENARFVPALIRRAVKELEQR